jgi:hypothetical protein
VLDEAGEGGEGVAAERELEGGVELDEGSPVPVVKSLVGSFAVDQ